MGLATTQKSMSGLPLHRLKCIAKRALSATRRLGDLSERGHAQCRPKMKGEALP